MTFSTFIYGLAIVAFGIVIVRAVHEMRGSRLGRVREHLRELLQQGESLLAMSEPGARACCSWGSQASEQVERLLVEPIAEEFARSIADLLVAAEMLERSAAAGAAERRATPSDLDCPASVRSGVAWLRVRSGLLQAGDIRGWFG